MLDDSPVRDLDSRLNELERELQFKEKIIREQAEHIAELHLQLSSVQNDYKELYNFNTSIYLLVDNNFSIKKFNFKASHLLNCEPLILQNRSFLSFVSEDTKCYLQRSFEQLDIMKTKQSCEIVLLNANADRKYVQVELTLLEDSLINITLIDVTSLRRLETEFYDLNRSYNLINSLFQTANEAIAAVDCDFNFIAINKSFIDTFSQVFAAKIAIGMSLPRLLGRRTSLKSRIMTACNMAISGHPSVIVIENSNLDEAVFYYEVYIALIDPVYSQRKKLYLHIKNLTSFKLQEREVHKRQTELERVARSNIMGELISALAHEINQPLTAIKAYSRSCLLKIKQDQAFSSLKFPLTQIANQSEHAGTILHRMKDFMRDGTMYLELTDINELIRQTIPFLYYERANKLRVELLLAERLPLLPLDRIKLMQVILNLGRNSIEAFEQSANSKLLITISTANEDGQLHIHFRDNGPGIPENIRNKILSSYFTTKSQGTGLGLSICRSLIKAHGGSLIINDNEKGAWVTISLPIKEAI
ncbi:ATP-binding protein [Legionella genomosp. 1]|uniref:sensor histidine kinase n=1 Tax=Legionella genomosp. 1 TaxID=1093625 RepID=UPI00105578D7|nr:ATP-binding protein [Legionella genomosp. 1]